jgi:hypothetical protein
MFISTQKSRGDHHFELPLKLRKNILSMDRIFCKFFKACAMIMYIKLMNTIFMDVIVYLLMF